MENKMILATLDFGMKCRNGRTVHTISVVRRAAYPSDGKNFWLETALGKSIPYHTLAEALRVLERDQRLLGGVLTVA